MFSAQIFVFFGWCKLSFLFFNVWGPYPFVQGVTRKMILRGMFSFPKLALIEPVQGSCLLQLLKIWPLDFLCFTVTSVRSARQVIDALNAEGQYIDIILAEVDLPIKKGMKLLKYIARDKELCRIPVISKPWFFIFIMNFVWLFMLGKLYPVPHQWFFIFWVGC